MTHPAFRRAALALWIPGTALLLWETCSATGLLNPLFFPRPSGLPGSLWRMLVSGELISALGATLTRLGVGSVIGAVTGLACGLAMGVLEPVRRSFSPVVSALNSTPKLALLPMLMLFTGIGETARILPIALGTFVLLAIHGLDAVRGVRHGYTEIARNYGARGWTLLRRVYLPASLPQVFTGIRLALGRALVMTISVEMMSAGNGLGNMIWLSWQTFSTDKLYIGVLTASLLGALFHNGLAWLEPRLMPWAVRTARA